MKKILSMHFSNINFELIKGNTKKDSEKAIIVMGAYSGSSFSRFFLKSTAESTIDETDNSLFITHQ